MSRRWKLPRFPTGLLAGTHRTQAPRRAGISGIALALAWLIGAGAASGAYAQITFRAATTASVTQTGGRIINSPGADAKVSTTGTVTPRLPSFWQPGDILICWIESRDNFQVTMPTGWQLLAEGSGPGGTHHAAVFWKRAQLGETDPTVTRVGGTGGVLVAAVTSFSGADMSNPFVGGISFTLNSPASQTIQAGPITTVSNNTLLLFGAFVGSFSSVPAQLPGNPPFYRIVSGGTALGGGRECLFTRRPA